MFSIDDLTGEVTALNPESLEIGDYVISVAATDAAGNVSSADYQLNEGHNPEAIFNLTDGTSSDHSGRQFQADVDYKIYIVVNNTDSAIFWNRDQMWSGAEQLDSNDMVYLVGPDGQSASIRGRTGAIPPQTNDIPISFL